MADEIQIIETKDGSHSLLNTALNETYHSHHGALRESQYVFIKNGLEFWLQENKANAVSIFEVGFGTGLNVILTMQQAITSKLQISYTSLEAFPLTLDIVNQLNYLDLMDADENLREIFTEMHTCAWNKDVEIISGFRLQKLQQKLQDLPKESMQVDLVYFDAFAPNKQPELWTYEMLALVTSFLKKNGVWVTYSAMGQMKRDLKALGLAVETLPGPPGKAEMVRAVKI